MMPSSMQALIAPRAFLALSWKRYTEHLGRFLEVSLWMLVPFFIQIAYIFLLTSTVTDTELRTVWTSNQILARTLQTVVMTWVQVRLIKLALAQNPKDEGYIVSHPHIGWAFVLPLLWVNILTGIAVFGGAIAFVIPGIWLFFSLLFSGIIVVDQRLRGLRALEASYALVRRRWWPVVGRVTLSGISFLGMLFLATFSFSLIFRVLFGGEALQTLSQLNRALLFDGVVSVDALRAFSLLELQDALIASIATPFLVASQVVLYRSLLEANAAPRQEG